MMAGSNEEMAEWVIGLSGVQPDEAVLDIGFGPGTAIELLGKRVPRRRKL